jgi:hypothetical protein
MDESDWQKTNMSDSAVSLYPQKERIFSKKKLENFSVVE